PAQKHTAPADLQGAFAALGHAVGALEGVGVRVVEELEGAFFRAVAPPKAAAGARNGVEVGGAADVEDAVRGGAPGAGDDVLDANGSRVGAVTPPQLSPGG